LPGHALLGRITPKKGGNYRGEKKKKANRGGGFANPEKTLKGLQMCYRQIRVTPRGGFGGVKSLGVFGSRGKKKKSSRSGSSNPLWKKRGGCCGGGISFFGKGRLRGKGKWAGLNLGLAQGMNNKERGLPPELIARYWSPPHARGKKKGLFRNFRPKVCGGVSNSSRGD